MAFSEYMNFRKKTGVLGFKPNNPTAWKLHELNLMIPYFLLSYNLLIFDIWTDYKSALQLFHCPPAIKCKPYCEIIVEIGTHLKTVKITSKIFAVCLGWEKGEKSLGMKKVESFQQWIFWPRAKKQSLSTLCHYDT